MAGGALCGMVRVPVLAYRSIRPCPKYPFTPIFWPSTLSLRAPEGLKARSRDDQRFVVARPIFRYLLPISACGARAADTQMPVRRPDYRGNQHARVDQPFPSRVLLGQ
jgi:hypothetical protein